LAWYLGDFWVYVIRTVDATAANAKLNKVFAFSQPGEHSLRGLLGVGRDLIHWGHSEDIIGGWVLRTHDTTTVAPPDGQRDALTDTQPTAAQENSGRVKKRRKYNRGSVLAVGIPTLLTLVALVFSQLWIAGLPSTYAAKSAVAFSPKVTANGSIPGSENVSLQASQYVVFLEQAQTVGAAANQSGLTSDALAGGAVEAAIVPGTATLSIAVTAQDPTQAAAAANSFAAQILLRAKTDTILTSAQIAAAVPPSNPSGPAGTILTVVSAAVSILLGLAALLVSLTWLRLLRTRPKGQRLPDWLSFTESGKASDRTKTDETGQRT
jgi:hypothetical protein